MAQEVELNFVSTDDLVNELRSRCESIALAYSLINQPESIQTCLYGPAASRFGLLGILHQNIAMQTKSRRKKES